MEQFIPYTKLSKKEQRRLNSLKRGDWGSISPVTRKSDKPKAYNRKKTQDWKKELPDLRLCFFVMPSARAACCPQRRH